MNKEEDKDDVTRVKAVLAALNGEETKKKIVGKARLMLTAEQVSDAIREYAVNHMLKPMKHGYYQSTSVSPVDGSAKVWSISYDEKDGHLSQEQRTTDFMLFYKEAP